MASNWNRIIFTHSDEAQRVCGSWVMSCRAFYFRSHAHRSANGVRCVCAKIVEILDLFERNKMKYSLTSQSAKEDEPHRLSWSVGRLFGLWFDRQIGDFGKKNLPVVVLLQRDTWISDVNTSLWIHSIFCTIYRTSYFDIGTHSFGQ